MFNDTQGIFRRISNLFSRGAVSRTNDKNKTQTMQVALFADELRDNLEHPQEYGFRSLAKSGAEVIAGFFGGNRDHGTVITVFDKRYKPKEELKPGEVCLYNHEEGTTILLKDGKKIEISAETSITIKSKKIILDGDVEVKGSITATKDITDNTGSDKAGKSMAEMRKTYNSHTHMVIKEGSPTEKPNNPMV